MKTLDLFEYASDGAAQAAYPTSELYTGDVIAGGTPTADSYYGTSYPSLACDDNLGTNWAASTSCPHWWKYDFGAGVTKIITRITIKAKIGGANMNFKDFTFLGSNNDSDWDTLYTGQYANSDTKQTFTFSNTTAYRYYKVNNTTTWNDSTWTEVYEFEFIEINLQCYSESSIKQQGSYSLEVIANVTAVNDTLTRAVTPTVDLSDMTKERFYIRASRTGSNIKISIKDSGGTWSEITPNVTTPNSWQEVDLDLSGVSNANKDAINTIKITIVNAAARNTFYIDNMVGGWPVHTFSEDLALDEALTSLERSQAAFTESLGLQANFGPFGWGLIAEENLALIAEEKTSLQSVLTESVGLLSEETMDLNQSYEESLALLEAVTSLDHGLALAETLALKEEGHADFVLFEIDEDGNIDFHGDLDFGGF